MKKRWIFALLLGLLAASADAQNYEQVPPQPALQLVIPNQVTFFDSKLFDAKLSKELEAGKSRVEVEVMGKVPLSNIPERIDRWITKVGEEGKVEMKQSDPAVRTRSFFGIIPMIFEGFRRMKEERMYEPASQYDATILYRKDAAGDTLIDRVIFTRKKAE